MTTDARTDWENRIGIRSGHAFGGAAPELRPARRAGAVAGGSQVTLTWEPGATGAIGYQVHVADSADGDWEPLDHAGRDVLAVPHPPYVDTTGDARRRSGGTPWPSLSDVHVEGRCPTACRRRRRPEPTGPVTVPSTRRRRRRRAAPAVAADDRQRAPLARHLDRHHRRPGDRRGAERGAVGRARGARRAPTCARTGSSATTSRSTARRTASRSTTSRAWTGSTTTSARSGSTRSWRSRSCRTTWPATRPRPCSTTPRSSRRRRTGSAGTTWSATSPRTSSSATATRSSSSGPFEVWNEANLEVFWSGTPEEYLKLYDVTAAAVREVDSRLVVGGPSSAAAGWVEELLAHAERVGCSGRLRLHPHLRLARRWTSGRCWSATAGPARRSGGPSGASRRRTSTRSATRSSPARSWLRGMLSAMGRIESLSYWVVSDHFEELGRPPALLHGGFGLRTVGELRKPRWWALAMLERLGPRRLPVSLSGDGGGSLVEAVAATDADGAWSRCMAWNLTLDQTKAAGSRALDRDVAVEVAGLDAGGDVPLTPRAGRRGPLQRRVGRGAGCARTGRTGRPTRSGRAARGRPARAPRARA